MRRHVFLVDPSVEEGSLHSIEKHVEESELALRSFCELGAMLEVLRQGIAGENAAAVLIGPGMQKPLTAARNIRVAWDGHLLFMPTQADLPTLRRDLAVAPMIGYNWSICVADDPNLPRILSNVVRGSLQRRHLRTTLDRANLRISARDSVDPARYRALLLADRYYATILRQAPEPIIALDARDTVTAWNLSAEQLLGHKASEALGTVVSALQRWPSALNAALAEARTGAQPVFADVSVEHAQAPRHFQATVSAVRDDAGAYIGSAIIMHDVTASMRALAAEQAARSHAERMNRMKDEFLAMVDGMAQLAWMARPDGWIYWYNKRWFEYTGTTPQDMDGWGWQSVHDPRTLPAVMERWKTSIATGEAFEMVFPLRRADGRFRFFLTRVSPLKGGDGKVLQWFGTNTDITAQLEAEEALREADRRKDEFLATLAHELRNPLAPIRSAIEIIGRIKPLPDAVETARSVLDRQSHHLIRLVDDLLELSRVTQGKLQLRKERLVLQQALRDAVEAARAMLHAAGHTLSVRLSDDPLNVDGDATRITQIVVNLLHNAIKFTPRGGHVWLTAERRGNQAIVSVRDSGIGIPAEHLPQVFEMFSQVAPALERTDGGLGIGLALVRGLAELHGGSVEAHSAGIGKGSEFMVRLPVANSDAGHDSARTKPASERALRGKRILVIDDNRDAATTLRHLLELTGHEVREAYDGVEGVDAAIRFRPDIVLLDIGMPRMNGYEAAREIRRKADGRRLYIIAMTGWGQQSDKERSRAAGFDLHLTKPVDVAALERLFSDQLWS